MPVVLYAARRGGSRYHGTPQCVGLVRTLAAGEVDRITRTAALARTLTPCALCDPPRIAHLAVA